MDSKIFSPQQGRATALYSSEIERHVDMIIHLVGQEYKEKLLNMQRLLNEKEYEKETISADVKLSKDRALELEMDIRKQQESITNLQYRLHQFEKIVLEKDEEYHKLLSQYGHLQNEDRSKDSMLKKVQGDFERLERENRYTKVDNAEKDKRIKELEEKIVSLQDRFQSVEKFVEAKEQIIQQMERSMLDVKDQSKRFELKAKEFEEENYAIRGQIERIKRERDFVQEEMEKLRNRTTTTA